MRFFTLVLVVSALAIADDSGVPPRDSSSNYPVHQRLKSLSIGAVALTSDQVRKLFSNEIASKYAVVEVAIYPEGLEVDVGREDFVLRVGEATLIHPDRPDEVALPWTDRKPPSLPGNTHVTTETGVVCGAGTGGTGPYGGTNGTNTGANNGAYNRPVRGCGTYEGVGVNNYPTAASPDPTATSRNTADIKIRNRALPEGKTTKPVAGYLYFLVSSKQRKAGLSLEYSKDGVSAELALPVGK